jgi:hypothetical protein
MSATWMNTGIDYAANVFLKRTAEVDLTARLYVNNYTPLVTSTAGNFTECTLTGYAALTLTPGSWSGSTSSGLATYTYPTITFTFSPYAGGTTIYGYYVTIPGVTAVLAELFSTPYAVPAGGGSLTLDVTYEDQKF